MTNSKKLHKNNTETEQNRTDFNMNTEQNRTEHTTTEQNSYETQQRHTHTRVHNIDDYDDETKKSKACKRKFHKHSHETAFRRTTLESKETTQSS